VDYPSYSHVLNDDNDQSPRAYLANATDALKRVCSSDSGKQAVKGKHMSVTVTHSATETGSLSNGDFRYTVLYRGHGLGTVFRVVGMFATVPRRTAPLAMLRHVLVQPLVAAW
jgi:hypothetical protein